MSQLVGLKGAKAFAHATAENLNRGELDVVELRNSDRIACVHAANAMELGAKDYDEASTFLEAG